MFCIVQIDVDIGSSSVARGVIGVVLGYVTSLVVDLAILIEVCAFLVTIFMDKLSSNGFIFPSSFWCRLDIWGSYDFMELCYVCNFRVDLVGEGCCSSVSVYPLFHYGIGLCLWFLFCTMLMLE